MRKIGLTADHAGFELKQYVKNRLIKSGYDIIDYGPTKLNPDDDYPDYVVPLAKAVADRAVERGVAICGSGVGACIAANKVAGVRACLINETFSAKQGVEDDDMNLICLGGRVMDQEKAWTLITLFLEAKFSGAERHARRLAKVIALEKN